MATPPSVRSWSRRATSDPGTLTSRPSRPSQRANGEISMANPNEHHIVWTVLPNGRAGNGQNAAFRVSIFVSLRLASAGGTLNASFNWPQRVNALSGVQVEFQNDAGMTVGSAVALTLDKSQLSLGSSSVWNQTFPGGSTVNAYPEEKIAQLVARPKVSYPIKPIRETVHTLY